MDAISYWKGVLAELGIVDSSKEQVRTPLPDKAAAGWEVFHTPVAVQQGTPVDAWHSILNTLTGNGKAAHTRVTQGNQGSPCSSSAASTRPAAAAAAQASPHVSPGMVRQLFTSTHSISNQGRVNSSPDSTFKLQQQGRVLFSAAADASPLRAFSSSPSKQASPARGSHTGSNAAAAAGSPQRHARQQRSPSPVASDTQQLADRLNNLRASAESILQGASHTAKHDAAHHSALSTSCSRSRCPSLAAAPCRVSSAPGIHPTTAAGQQEQPLPRQLFQSLPRSTIERRTGTNSKHGSPLQRLLQSQDRGQPCLPQQPQYVAAGGSLLPRSQVNVSHTLGLAGSSNGHTAAGVRQQYDPQLQQPLQQQLSGALCKLEQLLASLADKQPGSDLQQGAGSSSSSSSSQLLRQQNAAAGASAAAGHELQQAVLLLQQQQTGQLQQQEALQQIVLQQQLLIQQLLPLINRPGSTQLAEGDFGAVAAMPGSHASAMPSTGPSSLQQRAGVAAPSLPLPVPHVQDAAAAQGQAEGSSSSPLRQHGSFAAAGMPQVQLVLRPAAVRSSQALVGLGLGGVAESAAAAVGNTVDTTWQDPGSARAGFPRAGSISTGDMQDAVAAPGADLSVVQAESELSRQHRQQQPADVAHQGGGSAAAMEWAALMRGSDSSSTRDGFAAADQGLGRGAAAGSCAGSSTIGSSDAGSASIAGSTRPRRRWHMQPSNSAGPGCDLAPQQALPEAAVVQLEQQQASDDSDGQQAASGESAAPITLSQLLAAAAAVQATEARRRSWNAAGSRSLPAAVETASPRHDPGRFASQHVRSEPSSIAQRLGLPEVARFRGLNRSSSGDAGGGEAGGQWPGSSSQHGSDGNEQSSSRCSSDGAAVPAAAPAAGHTGELAAAQEALPRQGSGSSHGSGAEGAASVSSQDGSSEPETPTAALPRVHTPGKAAAEVVAQMTTPQLAHSAAAVMTVTEAWREESTGAQGRWQQLLAEWSASEIDTWETQRLTEPSAMSAPGSPRLAIALGLNRTFSAASRAPNSDADATQEQRQHQHGDSQNHSLHDGRSPAPSLNLSRLATVTGPQQVLLNQQQQCGVQDGAAAGQADGEQQHSEGGGLDDTQHQLQQEQQDHERLQEQEQQPQQQLTFARLAHDFVSPRKMPTHSGEEADRQPFKTGESLEAEASGTSNCTTSQPEQQLQHKQEQHEQMETAPLPSARTLLDTTRKQLFTSEAEGASGNSASSRSSSSGSSDLSDTRLGRTSAAQHGAGRGSASTPSAPASQPMADGCTNVGSRHQQQQELQQQEQQQLEQQLEQQQELEQLEYEELERLDRLLHELQGTVHLAAVTHAAGSTSGAAATAAAASHCLLEQQQRQEGHGQESDQSQQQQPKTLQACEQQEAEGLQRLGQLMQDLQGLQQSLHITELGGPATGLQQHPTSVWSPAPAVGAAAAAVPGQWGPAATPVTKYTATTVAATSAMQNGNLQTAEQAQSSAAAARDASVAAQQLAGQQLEAASLAAAAPAGEGAAAVTPPPRQSVTLTQSAAASSAMTQLKQRLQDTRAALQAISTPQLDTKPAPSTPHMVLASVCGAAAGSSTSVGRQGQQRPAAPGQAAAAAEAAAQGWAGPEASLTVAGSRSSPLSSLLGPTAVARPATVQQPQQSAHLTGRYSQQQQEQLATSGPNSAVRGHQTGADAGGDVAGAAAGAASAWLTGGSLQQFLNHRRSSTDRQASRQAGAAATATAVGLEAAAAASSGARDSSSRKQSWDADSNAGSSHVQALVKKWRAAAADGNMQQSEAALQQQQQQQSSGAKVPSWQSLLAQAPPAAVPGWLSGPSAFGQGPKPKYRTPPAQLGSAGTAVQGTGSQYSARSSTAAAYTGAPVAATPASGSALTALLQTPLFGGVTPASQWDGSAGREMPWAASAGRHSSRSSSLTPGVAAQSHPPIAAANWAAERLGSDAPYRTPGSSGVAAHSEGVAVQGRAANSGSGSRTVARSSSTPPSTGTLTRWARDGSPTRQLRQQLQAAARDTQHMQQERQQLQQQTLQVTPAAATLAKSLATIDRTLVGLRSVSPAVSAGRTGSTPTAVAGGASSGVAPASQYSPYSFAQGLSMGVSRRGGSSSSGIVAGAHNNGSTAAEVLAGAAAAADAVRMGLVGAKAQAAARPVSPLQRLRQQQLLLASISTQGRQPEVQHTAVAADKAAAAGPTRHQGNAASPYSSITLHARR